MAKLNFKKENSFFELEVGEAKYTGVLNDLTKEQKTNQDKITVPIKEKNEEIENTFREINRLEARLRVKTNLKAWAEVDELQEEIFKLQDKVKSDQDWLRENYLPEPMFKQRIIDTVESQFIDMILKAGEDYGYENVFNTILKDIKERNEKK